MSIDPNLKQVFEMVRSDLHEPGLLGWVKVRLLATNEKAFKSNVERLQRFVAPASSQQQTEQLDPWFQWIGLEGKSSKVRKLSMVSDENLYDLLDTFELYRWVQRMGGDITKGWELLQASLEDESGSGGAMAKENIQELCRAYNEFLESGVTTFDFDKLGRDENGKLVELGLK